MDATISKQYPQSPSTTNSPVPVITILSMLTIAILLSYYLFLFNCRCSGLLRLLSSSSAETFYDHHNIISQFRGLDQSVIHSIPVIKFSAANNNAECSVCLNEFQTNEWLKVLPNCTHAFHTDCIDTWLQFNSNCPLCRSNAIESATIATDQVVVLAPLSVSISTNVRAEVQNSESTVALSPSPKKIRDHQKLRSKGDEGIGVRLHNPDKDFSIQPLRRSISMDSWNDRQLFLAIQEYLKHQQSPGQDARFFGEGSSSNGDGHGRGRIRQSLFSFGQSSKSTLLPVHVNVSK